jgi:hypothetical protein
MHILQIINFINLHITHYALHNNNYNNYKIKEYRIIKITFFLPILN